ncbi:MAG: hypothetical protein ABW173_05405 [Sphingomonas sp.]
MMIDSGGTVVKKDMERVFSGLSGPPRPTPRPSGQTPMPPTRSGARRAIWIALAAVVLAIGAMIIFLRPAPAPAPMREPPPVPARESPAAARPASPPPIDRAPPAAPPVVDRSATVATAPPVRSGRTEKKIRPETKPQPATKTAGKPRAKAAKVAAPAAASPAPAAGAPLCQDVSDRAACFYEQVLRADRGMRRAYDRAVAEKVPVSELVRFRKTWKTALSRSRKEPLASIRTIEGLTANLAGRTRSAASRPE